MSGFTENNLSIMSFFGCCSGLSLVFLFHHAKTNERTSGDADDVLLNGKSGKVDDGSKVKSKPKNTQTVIRRKSVKLLV